MNTPIPTFVFGGRGLLAGEFARYALAHPALKLAALISRQTFDPQLEQPHLSPAPTILERDAGLRAVTGALQSNDRVVVVSALPHGASAAVFDEVRAAAGNELERLCFLDLASDFRLRDSELNRSTYDTDTHELQPQFAYGLPELNRGDWPDTRLVSAPGCFATALQLATLPAVQAGLLSSAAPWVYFGITGSSGSGSSPKASTHHPHREGNVWAYSTSGHRHEAELIQAVQSIQESAPEIHFIPHSGPFVRGIHLTATLPLADGVTESDLRSTYDEAYSGEPFVTRVDQRPVSLRGVVGSNRSEVGVHVRGSLATILITLDNLGKGGAGQGLQALNRVLGFSEDYGLSAAGQGVV